MKLVSFNAVTVLGEVRDGLRRLEARTLCQTRLAVMVAVHDILKRAQDVPAEMAQTMIILGCDMLTKVNDDGALSPQIRALNTII